MRILLVSLTILFSLIAVGFSVATIISIRKTERMLEDLERVYIHKFKPPKVGR